MLGIHHYHPCIVYRPIVSHVGVLQVTSMSRQNIVFEKDHIGYYFLISVALTQSDVYYYPLVGFISLLQVLFTL